MANIDDFDDIEDFDEDAATDAETLKLLRKKYLQQVKQSESIIIVSHPPPSPMPQNISVSTLHNPLHIVAAALFPKVTK